MYVHVHVHVAGPYESVVYFSVSIHCVMCVPCIQYMYHVHVVGGCRQA